MKNYFFLCLTFLLLNCNGSLETDYSITSEQVFLKITSNTTLSELTQISSELMEKKNILVDFAQSDFDKDGFIQKLDISVDCNDGMKGSTSANIVSLRIKPFGFLRDYREEAEHPFEIGSME